ncbi:MAG: histidinol dehydrogenase [Promethearchaeota archaeon]
MPIKIISSENIREDTIYSIIPRSELEIDSILNNVKEIIERVKIDGDKALIELTRKYDNIDLKAEDIKVNEKEFKIAYQEIDEKLLRALRFAKKNLIKFHKAQLREEWKIKIRDGVIAGQIYRPIESVGIYIPGGRAIYPSTVLMTATPAYVAGVKKIILCTPPQTDGRIAPEVLVAAKEFGIDNIFKVGGAQAIAAMAYGTKSIPRVLKIVGPGNKWVNAAKHLLSNIIAVDTPAGPSEILIIADESVPINFIISDFISQIEHDPDNIGIIISCSEELLNEINEAIDSYIMNCERKEIIKQALNNCVLIKAENIKDCFRINNLIAPEHLELLIENPRDYLNEINNAGAIFIGPYTPVPLGDYTAGTNHVLPTGGNAKKYSGLNVYDFLKIIDVLECNEEGIKNIGTAASIIADFEGLQGHKKSIEERLKSKN